MLPDRSGLPHHLWSFDKTILIDKDEPMMTLREEELRRRLNRGKWPSARRAGTITGEAASRMFGVGIVPGMVDGCRQRCKDLWCDFDVLSCDSRCAYHTGKLKVSASAHGLRPKCFQRH